MPYIYSTASASIRYTLWKEGAKNQLPSEHGSVVIAGGANVSNKHFVTPRGVVTKVTDAELELLNNIPQFKVDQERGFIKVSATKVDPEVAAAGMAQRDNAAPVTPEELESMGAEVSDDGKTVTPNPDTGKKKRK